MTNAQTVNARTQYSLSAADLQTVLALSRTGTLADAGEQLGLDASTVFRALQRLERGLGQRVFERTRSGYLPSELAQTLVEHAEQMEAALESARSAAQQRPELVSGRVRITTTDTVLHGLVAPALKVLKAAHPQLAYELHTGNELASLTRRDADIAVRATKRPPQHLVGKRIGPIRVAVYTAKKGTIKRYAEVEGGLATWIAPDDALPEHPSVVWRQRHFPKAVPVYRVNSILTVAELVALGLGVGVLPLFLAQARPELLQLTEPLADSQTDLWVLTHPESRHLRRVAAVYGHLASSLALE
jgi:DNA-binding transcriptional LysR family regulator